MTPQKAISELKLRLNKSDSHDYDNIEDWIAIQAINKAQLSLVRRTIQGINQTQDGDEETKIRIDDLQVLLTEKKLSGKNKDLYFESDVFPENYLFYKRIQPKASKDNCSITLESVFVEEANVSTYLGDWSMQPTFDFGQTFHTIIGNRIRIYRDSDFNIDDTILIYYRKPRLIDIATVIHEDGKQGKNVSLELKDDVCIKIIDEAASIIAGDIGSYDVAQNTGNREQRDN